MNGRILKSFKFIDLYNMKCYLKFCLKSKQIWIECTFLNKIHSLTFDLKNLHYHLLTKPVFNRDLTLDIDNADGHYRFGRI